MLVWTEDVWEKKRRAIEGEGRKREELIGEGWEKTGGEGCAERLMLEWIENMW